MHWALGATTLGGILQIVGVFLVFIQIRSAEKLLGAASWVSRFEDWLKASLTRRRNITILPGAASLAITTGVARITIQHGRGTTVEERLSSLQSQVDDARRELDELWTRSTADRAASERKLAEVESSIKAVDADLRGLITTLNIGSRHIQVLGAVLIMVGTALIIASPLLQ